MKNTLNVGYGNAKAGASGDTAGRATLAVSAKAPAANDKMWTDEESDEIIREAVESIFEQQKYEDPDGKRKAVAACLLRLQMVNK